MNPLPLRTALESILPQWPGPLSDDRKAQYQQLIDATLELEASPDPWHQLPELIAGIFGSRGWAWNGIYARAGEQLFLVASHGPPVCNTIDLGAVGENGMCSDAVALNRSVFAADVKTYRGYKSCDGESGLATKSGLVCPIRGPEGKPIAVWDLDCTEALERDDVLFFDAYFGTLSATWRPTSLFERQAIPSTPSSASTTPSTNNRSSNLDDTSNNIRLAQFLKWKGLVETGGIAKLMIQDGCVKVNGEVELRRGRRLRSGDQVEVDGKVMVVE